MIVLDASAIVELLLGSPIGRRVAARIGDPGLNLYAPQLLDLEVAQVLRRSVLQGGLEEGRARQALEHLQELDVDRYPHVPLLPRIWALRDNLTSYDAAYVSLAEALDAPLLTGDARLARSSGHAASVELVDGG